MSNPVDQEQEEKSEDEPKERIVKPVGQTFERRAAKEKRG